MAPSHQIPQLPDSSRVRFFASLADEVIPRDLVFIDLEFTGHRPAVQLHVLRPADRGLKAARLASDESPASVAHLLKTPQKCRALAVSGAVLVTVDLTYAFVPVWATGQGISATVVGFLLALRAAVSVASRFGLGRLVAHFGRKMLIITAVGAATAGLIALPFVGMWEPSPS